MYLIRRPDQFITTPWKNGLGETTELAINDGGSLKQFDWRLSMATVTQNGVFSNFEGYKRQLVLINGNGIELTHKSASLALVELADRLVNKLDMAEFDGGYQTYGQLLDGDITDFNIISNKNVIDSKVQLITQSQRLAIETSDLLFVYNLKSGVKIDITSAEKLDEPIKEKVLTLAEGELFQWTTSAKKSIVIDGENVIVIQLKHINLS